MSTDSEGRYFSADPKDAENDRLIAALERVKFSRGHQHAVDIANAALKACRCQSCGEPLSEPHRANCDRLAEQHP